MVQKLKGLLRVLVSNIYLLLHALAYRFRYYFLNIRGISLSLSSGSKLFFSQNFVSRGGLKINIGPTGAVRFNGRIFINRDCSINSRMSITFGNDVLIGEGVKFYDHDHDYRKDLFSNEFVCSEINIGDNVWIGSNAVILKGVSIGSGCVIGAGVVVSRSIPPGTIVTTDSHLRKRLIN